jgi:hypothetical protein
MPTLKIMIDVPLSDDGLAGFRERHEAEGVVIQMMDKLPEGSTVVCEVESGGLRSKSATEKRTRGPNKTRPAANGDAAATEQAQTFSNNAKLGLNLEHELAKTE